MPIELNLSTHVIWSLSCPQAVLALSLEKPNFHIVDLLFMIHWQYQGFKAGDYGAVSYQKCPILTEEEQFRDVQII